MNLSKLFETQDALDERIVKEKGLEGQDLLPMKILALQVEIGELANEWRGFKFWSKNQKPNVLESKCIYCHTLFVGEVEYCEGCYEEYEKHFPVTVYNPLLEEYVDCLHFILSIGLELGSDSEAENAKVLMAPQTSITESILYLFQLAGEMRGTFTYTLIFRRFIELGEMLGFTSEQIESAYYAKNKINHERQSTGY